MTDDKQYVDAGEVRKVRDMAQAWKKTSYAKGRTYQDAGKGELAGPHLDIGNGLDGLVNDLHTLLTTATPLAPDPRYAALRAEVVKVRDSIKAISVSFTTPLTREWECDLTAALDAAPGDAPATFPEGIPIQVDAELYYRFKGYRENDMAGEPEETFTIYVTPESSFAPPPSPTVPVSEIEDALETAPHVYSGKHSHGKALFYVQKRHIKRLLNNYRPPPDAPADEPCATCGDAHYINAYTRKPTYFKDGSEIPCPDCPPKGEPDIPKDYADLLTPGILAAAGNAPAPPSVEERARWFYSHRPADQSAWSLARALSGDNDEAITAWLAAQEQGKGVE